MDKDLCTVDWISWGSDQIVQITRLEVANLPGRLVFDFIYPRSGLRNGRHGA